MPKITVIAAHPAPQKSLANRLVLERFSELLPKAEIVSLAASYPDWYFDVEKEQQRLVAAGTLIFEFPVWWYAAPWTLLKYISDVFSYGFVYGTAFALEKKKAILSLTCGGGERSYTRDGLYHCTIDEIMLPLYATLRYCRLDFLGNVISYHMMPEDCPVEQIEEKAKNHGERLAKLAAQ